MTPEQMARLKEQAAQLAAALNISTEAAALIIELHDLGQAFRDVAEAMQAPRPYVMREVTDMATGDSRMFFDPAPRGEVPDA